MARLTIGQKANRVLKFLLGMRHPRISGAMREHGFDQRELDVGWALLRELTANRLDQPPPNRDTPNALKDLDGWENRWFPIVRASLERHFPDVAAQVFANLRQTEGVEVIVSVDTLLSRLRELGTQEGGEAVLALLAERGLTPEERARAEALVATLGAVGQPSGLARSDAETRAAEDALWSWYLEWSTVARAVVKDRRLLRSMGFLRYRPGSAQLVEVEEVLTDDPDEPEPEAEALPEDDAPQLLAESNG
ncbi:MAG: hypothetical protein AAGH15_06380 [Myxococcota bacterium]